MEIIKIIDGSAGRTVTVTGLTQTTVTQDNIIGIINEGNGKTLYSPINRGNITGVTYSDGTLTITLKDTVTAIAAGDKVLVKLYFDDVASGGGDATEATSQQILAAVKNNDTTALAELLSQTYGLAALQTLISGISGYALETSVKDGNDTAIGLLKDATNGLAAIRTLVAAISGYALQGSDNTATNTAISTALANFITEVVTTHPYAKEANATQNKNDVISAVNGAMSVNFLANGIQAMADAPLVVVPDGAQAETVTMNTNTLYVFQTRVSDLTLAFGAPTAGIVNEYHMLLTVGSTIPTITLPAGVTWAYNDNPLDNLTTGATYEIGFLYNASGVYFAIYNIYA